MIDRGPLTAADEDAVTTRDAGHLDAGHLDAGHLDAGERDAAAMDGDVEDADVGDGGPKEDGGPSVDGGVDGGVDAGPPGCGEHAETCNRRDDDCDGAVDEGACKVGSTVCLSMTWGGHVYLYCPKKEKWEDARDFCTRNGYQLARIDDAEENARIVTMLDDDNAWIGLWDPHESGSYEWLDGTRLGAWDAWAAGEPNNARGLEHCVELSASGGWNDQRCDRKRHFVCEAEIDTTRSPD